VLYEELDREYGLMLRVEHLRVAINDDFAEWDTLLLAGDRVAFLPPMSGG
jgi:molybdopterin synthase sulfur carrier subunit